MAPFPPKTEEAEAVAMAAENREASISGTSL